MAYPIALGFLQVLSGLNLSDCLGGLVFLESLRRQQILSSETFSLNLLIVAKERLIV